MLIKGMSAAASGLSVEATCLNQTAHNIANVNTDGFQPGRVEQADVQGGGVRVTGITQMPAGPTIDTGDGEVQVSGTDLGTEMVNLITTERSAEANMKTIQTADEMLGTILDVKG